MSSNPIRAVQLVHDYAETRDDYEKLYISIDKKMLIHNGYWFDHSTTHHFYDIEGALRKISGVLESLNRIVTDREVLQNISEVYRISQIKF